MPLPALRAEPLHELELPFVVPPGRKATPDVHIVKEIWNGESGIVSVWVCATDPVSQDAARHRRPERAVSDGAVLLRGVGWKRLVHETGKASSEESRQNGVAAARRSGASARVADENPGAADELEYWYTHTYPP